MIHDEFVNFFKDASVGLLDLTDSSLDTTDDERRGTIPGDGERRLWKAYRLALYAARLGW